MMKRCVLILILLAMVTGFAAADDLDNVWIICHPDSYIIIRSSPKKANNQEATAYLGYRYQTDGKTRNGFTHIYGGFEAGEGWIASRYVSYQEPEIFPDGRLFTVIVKSVNCWQYIGGKRTGKLRKGADVRVYAETDEWCVTNQGYIQTRFLERKDLNEN